jgi:hypothetical protein
MVLDADTKEFIDSEVDKYMKEHPTASREQLTKNYQLIYGRNVDQPGARHVTVTVNWNGFKITWGGMEKAPHDPHPAPDESNIGPRKELPPGGAGEQDAG